ncbi:DUF6894 family protein [Methylobacterium terricola]
MPHYRFRLKLYGQPLKDGAWLELENKQAALAKARQLAQAFLDFGDRSVPWTEAVVVVEDSDGSEVVHVPIGDLIGSGAETLRH